MEQEKPRQHEKHSIANGSQDLTEHLRVVHGAIISRYPSIDRVALATYDSASDTLKTFVSSNSDGVRLDHYTAKLSEVPSLANLVKTRQTRVVEDINSTLSTQTPHTNWLKSREYRSSFTVPIFNSGQFAAFLFFDSKLPNAFDKDTANFLEVFSNLISQLYLLQLQVVRSMVGTVHLASGLARIRDLETGQHLSRMAAYSRLMAQEIAITHKLTDEYIEYVFLFAPLHDIGKVGIPDRILLKPGKLEGDEWETMKRHVDIGIDIVEQMANEIRFGNEMAYNVMRNIVAQHHERGDGRGYPSGLTLSQISMEARIVAVADVYDALTCVRPYKVAWPEEKVAEELMSEVYRDRLDGDCVNALLRCKEMRYKIAKDYADACPNESVTTPASAP